MIGIENIEYNVMMKEREENLQSNPYHFAIELHFFFFFAGQGGCGGLECLIL